VCLALNLLDEHLPAITEHLHYCMLDVSTMTGLALWWKGVPAFDKAGSCTAMADIRESIAELR
jgi:oligoribonuclease